MKRYYTLIQKFNPDRDRYLDQYLQQNEIEHHISAEFANELLRYGLDRNFVLVGESVLLKKCVVLIEPDEMTAIQLSVGGVVQIRNRPWIEFKNKIRACASSVIGLFTR